jgi:hypothetical protein
MGRDSSREILGKGKLISETDTADYELPTYPPNQGICRTDEYSDSRHERQDRKERNRGQETDTDTDKSVQRTDEKVSRCSQGMRMKCEEKVTGKEMLKERAEISLTRNRSRTEQEEMGIKNVRQVE